MNGPHRQSVCRRRGMVLPIVLLMLILLGLLAASSSFYVHADYSATQSAALRFQTRMAAEAGLEKVLLFLRTERGNVEAWHHNPDEFHRIILWSDVGGLEVLGTNQEFEEAERATAFRFSIVADDPADHERLVRYGITDESSKLNINTATKAQLATLIIRFATEEMIISELVDALVDWRDRDQVAGAFGAEDAYYAQLEPPYKVKNGPFDTVEELLLVRGFTGELLYGEDYDRNGLMSPNENDGEETFPPDNQDDELNTGLYPHITVYSRDMNTTSENKPRVYLMGEPSVVQQQLSEFVDDQAKQNFISQAKQSQPPIQSPADLLKDRERQTEEGVIASPLTEADMIWVMDRCTTSPLPELEGLINVHTASEAVLATLPGLTPEDVQTILEARVELTPEDKKSVGWLASVLGRDKFIGIAPMISARGTRFRVDSLGYGDHVGTRTRLEAIVEMRGPVPQVVYLRDLTALGTNFPIRYAEGDTELEGYRD